MGFPIRKSADQSFFAAPRGLSQRSTSFIASQRQGIHQMPLSHLIALIINAHPARQRTRSSVLTNGSIGRTLIRKTSLLRIVPTACGQAADIALRYAIPSPRRLSSPCDVITFQCSELRAGRDITSRSTLGAILPLHDVRYHASHTKPRGFPLDAKDVLADKPKTPAGGARRDRTDDLLLAKQALSQLSYGPSGEQ